MLEADDDTLREVDVVLNYQLEQQMAQSTGENTDSYDPFEMDPAKVAADPLKYKTAVKTQQHQRDDQYFGWMNQIQGLSKQLAGCQGEFFVIQEHKEKGRMIKAAGISKHIIDYTLDRIKEAPVEQTPYQHLYVTNVFEPSFYRCMMANLPYEYKPEEYSFESRETRQTLPLGFSRVGDVRKQALAYGNVLETEWEFWQAFNRAFNTWKFRSMLMRKFNDTLSARYATSNMPDPAQYREVYNEMGGAGAINKGNPLFSEFSLVRDLAGFKQGTHSYKKGRNVLVQGAFTLEQRATVLELGADIWSTGATPFVDDTAHKRLGYYPNTFFAHAPCKNGVFRWNGVTEDVETRKGVHSRNLLQVELRLDGLWERNHLGEKGYGDLKLGGAQTTSLVMCGAPAAWDDESVFRRDRLVNHVMRSTWAERKKQENRKLKQSFAEQMLRTSTELRAKVAERQRLHA